MPSIALPLIPKDACVITDSASYLLIGDRFTSDVPGCPQMVDSLGTDLALGGGRRPGAGANQDPAVMTAWRQMFSAAEWVLLTYKASVRVPWDPALRAFFHERFRLVRHVNTYNLYIREGPGPKAE